MARNGGKSKFRWISWLHDAQNTARRLAPSPTDLVVAAIILTFVARDIVVARSILSKKKKADKEE